MNTLPNASFSAITTQTPDTLVAGDLHWSDEACRVTVAGTPVRLRPAEFRLLGQLMRQTDRVQTRAQLLTKARGQIVGSSERTIDVHIRRLRLSLQPFGMDRWIQTAPARGYRFSPSQIF